MRYGSLEYGYAAPIAEGMAHDPTFRAWVISGTKFADQATAARLLHEEMLAARNASSWWRSHFTESCRCDGCSGQETDLLAVFEAGRGRFALHFEVKQPKDIFAPGKRQAANYRTRAACWVTKAPKAVLKHSDASTVLLCTEEHLSKFPDQAQQFDSIITFEEIRGAFPSIRLPLR